MTFCVIPARGGSKRLPNKNKKLLGNIPIITYPIRAALDSGLFSDVIVSSDDPEILNIAIDCGATAHERPGAMARDDVSEIEAYRYVLNSLTEMHEYFTSIYPCAALITPNDIIKSFHHTLQTDADVCMGVNKFQQHPYQMLVKTGDYFGLNFPTLNDAPYPEALASNGSIYHFRTQHFLKSPCYYPEKLAIYETDNIDVNTIEDWERLEDEFTRRKQK